MPTLNLIPGQVQRIGRTPVDLLLLAGIGGVPPNNLYFVSSLTGSNASGNGTKDTPFATLTYALAACTANKGDIIVLLPGHAETISSAGGIAIAKAGVRIIGQGQGAKRPTFTFGTATTATMTITANDVTLENIVGLCALDGLISPWVISGANVTLGTPEAPVEWQDGSSAIEALRAVLTTAAADRLTVNLIYRGYTAGDAGVNAIRLVGCDGGRITLDYYGKCTTAIVELHTTACTNVDVGGRFYLSGTTDYSKNVVDTQGSSKWTVHGFDAAADSYFLGGDAVAVHGDPSITAVTDALYGSAGIPTFPASAVPANAVSIAEVLRDVWDALRNGTGGTEPGTNKSIVDALGYDGVTALTSTAGMLRTQAGSPFVIQSTVTSSAIPNNTQTGGAITGAASGVIVVEDIILETDATGVANPTNLNFTTDNVSGLTGASAPVCAEAVSALGANKTISIKAEGTTKHLPFTLESTKKLYISGSSAAGTGAGVVRVTLLCRRVSDGAALAAVNL